MKKMNSLVAMFLSVMPLFFVSCDNFLSGNEVKESLENEINWAKVSDPLKVEYAIPAFSSKGVYQDSSIEIMFNKPVNPATFKYWINAGEEDFKEYYCQPEFFKGNAAVRLRANPDKPIDLAFGDVMDVTVTIDKGLKAADGTVFSRDNYSFYFKLNHSKDDVAPVITDFKVYKYISETDSKLYLTEKPFDLWTDEDFSKYHLGSLGVECKIRDECTGAEGVLMTEEFLYASDGTKINWDRKQTSVRKLNFKADNDDLTLYEADEVVPSYYDDDGVVKITFQIIDANGNVSKEKFTYYILYSERHKVSFYSKD